eukprot:CAMPEP_0175819996 /NCGR_PEP_ID=MMETSP0107_2-20121207/8368_1 /TAXON_ID=195067 ORGANISM="Goniomonas pacifica, Strain CCMP1869" /NCGR_SAMPLE_ID=MMETSP0107_2 /ASSEMBLY_ACC=CAM_ASM_000203 /LENGTH=33 /DNA_ID= /DNA_START= /DNA_END= /DNA_ORIENTATION=
MSFCHANPEHGVEDKEQKAKDSDAIEDQKELGA